MAGSGQSQGDNHRVMFEVSCCDIVLLTSVRVRSDSTPEEKVRKKYRDRVSVVSCLQYSATCAAFVPTHTPANECLYAHTVWDKKQMIVFKSALAVTLMQIH